MISFKNIFWSCAILATFTSVTSFNLPSSKNDTASANNATDPLINSTTPGTIADSNMTSPIVNSTSGGCGLNSTTAGNSTSNGLNNTTMTVNSTGIGFDNTTSCNSTGDGLDDRFNFNLNRAGAVGFGNSGGISGSSALSFGANAGIKTSSGQQHNLFNGNGSSTNSFSHGAGAPLTYADTTSINRPGLGNGGNASAGIIGGNGKGSSIAQSLNQNIEIPLDNHGTVFFHDLKERNNSTVSSTTSSPANSTNSTTAGSSEKKQEMPDSLVFS